MASPAPRGGSAQHLVTIVKTLQKYEGVFISPARAVEKEPACTAVSSRENVDMWKIRCKGWEQSYPAPL